MNERKYPLGWDEKYVREVLAHYNRLKKKLSPKTKLRLSTTTNP